MYCPKCGTDAYVVDSRMQQDGTRRRKYKCGECGTRFNTIERAAGDAVTLAAKFTLCERKLEMANQKLASIKAILES